MISNKFLLKKISRSILVTILVSLLLPLVLSDYCDPVCPAPCQPGVRQENITTATVDWAQLWPHLAEDCVRQVTIVTNGVAHETSREDRSRQNMHIPVLPCVEYEIEVYADLTNRESADADLVKFTAKDQPELTEDAASNVHIVYGSVSVSRKRDVTYVTSVEVKGTFDDILDDKDCKSIQHAFILYKTEEDEEWKKEELDPTSDTFEHDLYLPDYCKKYQFKLHFEGFPGTIPITLELETTIGPANIEETGLENVPSIEDLEVVTGISKAVIEWKQPDCVPSYEYVVYRMEDCYEEEDFSDCFEDSTESDNPDTFDLELVYKGKEEQGSRFKREIDNLDSCTEYVILARTINEYGKGEIVSKRFRTRETDSDEEDLSNLAIVGQQSDESYYPTVTNLKVTPGVTTAKVSWKQPECFPDYELQVVSMEDCESYEKCVAEFSSDVAETAEKKTNFHEFANLESCTEYVAMARTTGDYGDGGVVGTIFWTLPEMGTPFTISNLRVKPGRHSLQLRWTNEELPCISRYVVRTCTVSDPHTCQAEMVTHDRDRSPNWISTTIENLTTCTQYSLEIGAGPYIYRQQTGTTAEYDAGEEETLLEETISKLWTAEQGAFKAFASTSPDVVPVSNISITTTNDKVMANWEQLKCVDHYIMKLEKVENLQTVEKDFADDEDYENDDQGSGSGEYSTTRPKREMTKGTLLSLIREESPTSEMFTTMFDESHEDNTRDIPTNTTNVRESTTKEGLLLKDSTEQPETSSTAFDEDTTNYGRTSNTEQVTTDLHSVPMKVLMESIYSQKEHESTIRNIVAEMGDIEYEAEIMDTDYTTEENLKFASTLVTNTKEVDEEITTMRTDVLDVAGKIERESTILNNPLEIDSATEQFDKDNSETTIKSLLDTEKELIDIDDSVMYSGDQTTLKKTSSEITTTTENSWWGKRKKRSPKANYDYDDYAEDDDDIYALLALSDDESKDNDDYDYGNDDSDDIYDILALGNERDSEASKKVEEEGSGSDYYDIDIDLATTAMAENVNKILGLDDDLPEKSDNSLKTKIVDSNSGEIDGLESCTKYALEVIAVYKNNATVPSEQKQFNTKCTSGTPCDPDDWQDTLEISQESEDDSLQIIFTWKGCPNDIFMLKLTCQQTSDKCKVYSEPGNYKNGQFEVTLTSLAFCTPYKMSLVKETTSIQREFVSIQNPDEQMNLTDFKLEMKSLKFGLYPSATEGSATASWVHDHVCIPTYGIRLCGEDKCGESVQTAGKVGEKIEIDLHMIAGLLRLQHCMPYQLYILPDTQLRKLHGNDQPKNGWNAGHVSQFTFIPGYDPPRNPADFGTNGEEVPNIVMFANDVTVDLEWRPPNKCVQGHVIKVFAIRHLPNLRQDFIDAENEPLVFQSRVNQSFWTKPDAEFTVDTNLTSCMRYRVEICSVFYDLYQGEIISEPLVQYFKTKAGDRVTVPYMDKEVVPQKTVDTSQTIFQFADRCAPSYFLSVCLFPEHCDKSQYATYTIEENAEKSSRGYYEQAVPSLLPCSVFKWEIMSAQNNFSLFKEYLFTEVNLDQFEFHLANLKTDFNSDSVDLSWTLTQPCIDEYQIHVCSKEGDNCWVGNFSRPEIESDNDFNIDIDLELLDGFNFEFEACEKYELTIVPSVNQQLLDTRIKVPFTYIINPKPPVKLNVTDTTESSFLVSWVSSGCSMGTEVVVLKEGKVVEEYILSEAISEYRVENLERCSDYVIELFGLHNNKRSNESQIMLAITDHGEDIAINIEADIMNMTVTVMENMTKCVSEYTINICEAGDECTEDGQANCTSVVMKSNHLSHTFTNLTEKTLYTVTVTGQDHHNQTTWQSQLQCSRTGDRARILLEPVHVTEHNFTLLLNLDEIQAEEDLIINLKASISCEQKNGEHSYERTGYATQFVFTHLEPDTEYKCGGFARLGSDKIEISDTVIHTADEIPDKVGSVIITEKTTNSFLISWHKPDKTKGSMQSYKISFTSDCENTNQPDCPSAVEMKYPCLHAEDITVGSNNTSYRHQATPGTKYTVQVSAKTRHPTYGPPSDMTVVQTLSEKPHKPKILRAEKTITGSVLLEFDYPCPHTGPTLFEVHYYCNMTKCESEHFQETEKIIKSARFFEVKGLPSGYEYNLRIEAIVKNCVDDSQNYLDSEENAYDTSFLEYAYSSLDQCSSFSDPYSVNIECTHKCADGTCINRSSGVRCNWVVECPDGSDEWNCECSGFSCSNNFCIPHSQRCDGTVQCNDATDEHGCPGCEQDQFRCARSGKCIPGKKACDKVLDCWDGSDEKNCPYRKHICWPNKFKCFDGRCISASKRCDRVSDCPQGEDEQNCQFQCELDEFTCKDGGCIKQKNVCDDTLDCDDGSDEPKHCHCYLLGEFPCETSGQCLKRHKVCDGTSDCKDNSDENECEALTRPIYRNQFTMTSPRLEAIANTSPYTPQYTHEETSTDKYPDLQITNLQPSSHSKLQTKGFKSLSQTKINSDDQHPNSVLFSSQEEDTDLDRSSPIYSKSWQYDKYPDYNRYTQYFTNRQNPPSEQFSSLDDTLTPQSLTSKNTHIKNYQTTVSSSTDSSPPPHWQRLVSVQTYPQTQTLLEGYDAVLQCRDEGRLRRDVFWQREGGKHLPAHSAQERGRLEILGVTEEDGGEYECVAVGYEQEDGGKQISTVIIEKR
eukprot:GFUD01031522.1.p1 GENE.GFUD01031522.1~~GFUD01031522.1.p1  ORF type:complete len:2660 (+),score=730.01 GFUD01031522.1:322-8301(+)